MPVDYTVPAIDRTVRLLEILSTSPRGHSLADLAEQLDVPKSTLFRILHTLQEHAIVVEDPERKLFTLGMKLLDWGYTALSKIDLKSIAHPHLQSFAHKTKESVYLAILDELEVILIDHVDTLEVWKIVTRLGHRSPIHCTASGLVLVAEAEPAVINEIVKTKGLEKFTERTITTITKLKARLKEIRRDGFSIVDGEYKPDLCAIAVPIRDHTGKIVASLMTAILSDKYRRNRKHANELAKALDQEAAAISTRLGYNAARTKS